MTARKSIATSDDSTVTPPGKGTSDTLSVQARSSFTSMESGEMRADPSIEKFCSQTAEDSKINAENDSGDDKSVAGINTPEGSEDECEAKDSPNPSNATFHRTKETSSQGSQPVARGRFLEVTNSFNGPGTFNRIAGDPGNFYDNVKIENRNNGAGSVNLVCNAHGWEDNNPAFARMMQVMRGANGGPQANPTT